MDTVLEQLFESPKPNLFYDSFTASWTTSRCAASSSTPP